MSKHWLLAISLGLSVSSVHAAGGGGIYADVSTLGIGIGYEHAVTPNMGARIGFHGGKLGYDTTENNIRYDGDLKFSSVEALLDFYPSSSGFRVTAGLFYNDNKVKLVGQTSGVGTVEVNGTTYTVTNPNLEFNGRLDKGRVSPYLGVGWSTGARQSGAGWGFKADLGVLYQRPEARLTLAGVNDPFGTLEADRIAAEQRLQNDLDDVKAYPVISFGAVYRF